MTCRYCGQLDDDHQMGCYFMAETTNQRTERLSGVPALGQPPNYGMGPNMTEDLLPMQEKLAAFDQAKCEEIVKRACDRAPPPLDDVGGCSPHDFYPEEIDGLRMLDSFDPVEDDDDWFEEYLKTPDAQNEIRKTLEQRERTHGDFANNAHIAQHLREFWRQHPGWRSLTLMQREALDQMAGKFSRILSGDSSFLDHWYDIAGYAILTFTALTSGSPEA
jgi:hypothetical protein